MLFFRDIVLASSLAAGLVASQATPIPPSQDSWYTAPTGFESTSPGTVLRLRRAPGNFTSIYNNSDSAWNILYRTTDSNYQPTWAVTTVFTPKNHTTESKSKSTLVSYQIPYNSPDVDASPSYALYDPAFYTGITQGDIQTLLGYGWFVSVPDHEGPLAAFACSVSEGHATLDNIRSIKSLNQSWSPARDVQVAMWGYSGGSLASEFAAELQVQYAPELEVAGMAIGGLVTNGSRTIQLASGGPFAGLVPSALVGISKQHADFNETLRGSLKQSGPYNATTFFSVLHMNIAQIFASFAGQDVSQYFTDGFAVFGSPAFLKVLNNDALMGYHGTPQMPMFVYKAIGDELCPIDETDALVDRYCGVGANVVYERNTVGGHLAEQTNGDASAIVWLHEVLGGRYNHTGCTVRNIALNVTDSPL